MKRGLSASLALAAVLLVQGGLARAQYGYPVGYGGYGWGGWGGGATPQGDMARGMGVYAAGAGVYNEKTAVANSINANTVMQWNQYMYESALQSARVERARQAKRLQNTVETQATLEKRLRENPNSRDIYQGDALNVALEEISNPAIYVKALSGAKIKIGGETIRNIPFQYATGAITTSLHQIMQGPPPAALMTDDFAPDRAAFKALGQDIRSHIEEGKNPSKATLDKALAVVDAAEAKADRILEKNSRDRVAADKYLKALHGLLAMMETPAMDLILAGVEKRPDATLGELLSFMNAYNLRFGPADMPQQRQIYSDLYPKLAKLRNEVTAGLAPEPPKANGAAAGDFFSGMDYADLKKKAAPPPPPAPQP
jgi:hypothetical protein